MSEIPNSPNLPIPKIEDGLYLGNTTSSHRLHILRENNISAMVSLVAGSLAYWRRPRNRELIPEEHHLYIPCRDSKTQNLLPELAGICDFIDHFRYGGSLPSSSIPSSPQEFVRHNVLAHCYMGISRSSTAAIAYLMRTHQWSYDTASAFVGAKRKIKPNSNFREQLEVWGEVGYEIWGGLQSKIPKAPYAAYLKRRAERLKARGLSGDEPVVPDL